MHDKAIDNLLNLVAYVVTFEEISLSSIIVITDSSGPRESRIVIIVMYGRGFNVRHHSLCKWLFSLHNS